MQTSHIISDAVLALVGFYVFFRYLLKLDLMSTILWESFILSVAVAAAFGALKYAGVSQASEISIFFQKVAATVGAIGLVIAAYQLISGRMVSNAVGLSIVAIGFLLLGISEYYDAVKVRDLMALVGLPIVALLGAWGLAQGKRVEGGLLIAGVIFTGLAVFSSKFIPSADDSIDAYHYLLAIGILCFGLAAAKQRRLN